MLKTKREIFDSFSAYNDGSFDVTKPYKPIVAYKICKNINEIERLQEPIAIDVDSLRKQYGWDPNEEHGGLEPEAYKNYLADYNELLAEPVEADISLISISEFDDPLSMDEMRVLIIMLEPL